MIVALAGGVGGSKLAFGLYHAIEANGLAVIVNTGDDMDLLGLRICPDLDTVMYCLAGLANPQTGWGVRDDTFSCLDGLAAFGLPSWFRLGDRDMATHLARTHLLKEGRTLTEATAQLAGALGIKARLLPMCDEPVATKVMTPEGELAFQEYFVRRRAQDHVLGLRFEGIEKAQPTRAVIEAIEAADLIVLCPSNPILSVQPILSVPGLQAALERAVAPKVAVTPIVGGMALRGPAASILADLGHESSAFAVAKIYAGLIDGFVLDTTDAPDAGRIEALGMAVLTTNTVMLSAEDRVDLAREVLAFGGRIKR